jgi:hypothetical protein
MYALRYRDNDMRAPATLIELTRAQVKLFDGNDTFSDDVWCYQYQSFQQAHQWVRDGGHHETPLYIDHGRILYARDY